MKLWQYQIMERYPPFEGWDQQFIEMPERATRYRAIYSKPGIGKIYLFFSEDLRLIDCAGTLNYYFQIHPSDLVWDLNSLLTSHQVKH